MIRFSIIIPCYNSERFINICIESLLRMSFDKNLFEVIFVDDCSTDNTIQTIIDTTTDTGLKIRLLKNKENSGPGACRRYAAEMADGEFLIFCDSDDWYEPNLLTDLEKEIDKNGSDIVLFDMSYILGGKKVIKNYTAPFRYGDKSTYLLNCAESLCNLVVKRSIFLSVPTIDIRNGEDLALVPLLIFKAAKITHIDKSYYNYVMRGNSVSLGVLTKEAYYNMILAFEHIFKHLKSDNQDLSSCIEFLGIKIVLYSATLMAIKGGNNNQLLSKIVSDFSISYPSWYLNVNKQKLNKLKILYFWFLKHKFWFACRVFASLHTYILTRK